MIPGLGYNDLERIALDLGVHLEDPDHKGPQEVFRVLRSYRGQHLGDVTARGRGGVSPRRSSEGRFKNFSPAGYRPSPRRGTPNPHSGPDSSSRGKGGPPHSCGGKSRRGASRHASARSKNRPSNEDLFLFY